jgi:cytochrome c-type biogenesis protein CcmH
MTVFLVVAISMTAALAAYLLLPAWRRGRSADGGRSKALKAALAAGVLSQAEYDVKAAELAAGAVQKPPARISRLQAAFIAVLLPVLAFLIYFAVGRPDALTMPQTESAAPSAAATTAGPVGMDMPKAIESLKAKLAENPGDADGWLLLGRAYKSVDDNPSALEALKKAYALSPGRPDIQIAYAEAMALMSPTRRIEGEPLRLIRSALEAEPMNQDGLWLLGMSDYQNGRYAEAVASWEKIREQLPPDSEVLANVTGMIDDANAILAGNPPGTAMPSSGPVQPVSGGPKLTVNVALAPEKAGLVKPGDTLFVYAKAASGPPMPIAIRKLLASDLPTTVVLTDGMGMTPAMNLSQFPQVVVVARVSRTGNAVPQAGDLQAVSPTLVLASTKTVNLSINQAVK